MSWSPAWPQSQWWRCRGTSLWSDAHTGSSPPKLSLPPEEPTASLTLPTASLQPASLSWYTSLPLPLSRPQHFHVARPLLLPQESLSPREPQKPQGSLQLQWPLQPQGPPQPTLVIGLAMWASKLFTDLSDIILSLLDLLSQIHLVLSSLKQPFLST